MRIKSLLIALALSVAASPALAEHGHGGHGGGWNHHRGHGGGWHRGGGWRHGGWLGYRPYSRPRVVVHFGGYYPGFYGGYYGPGSYESYYYGGYRPYYPYHRHSRHCRHRW